MALCQLSPGKLTNAHQELEGLSNCTQCHTIGNKVPDSKCLDCHYEIASLITANRGYHSSSEVSEKTCINCHSEHHGRNFDMSRFDSENFNHNLTGYQLEGEHTQLDCRDCHNSSHIRNTELSSRPDTYLGLEIDCLNCHDDFHQGTLSNNCIQCHDFNQFRPASKFNHSETNFPLKGAHSDVDCNKCHTKEIRGGEDYQVFSGLAFSVCIDCHENPHRTNFGTSCTTCHHEESFDQFIGQNRFRHQQTGFDLIGAHASLNCFECHNSSLNANAIFSDQVGIKNGQCAQCHFDPHEGKFGTNCKDCHTETSFLVLKEMNSFDHDLTEFRLEGLHTEVDCKECHKTNFTDEIHHEHCFDCHSDYHEGEFAENGMVRNCADCHTVDQPFTYSHFDIIDHETASFPLEGSHIATPCFECHLSEERWKFREIGNTCVDCHKDIHEDYISETYYPNQNCTQCHNPESWREIAFDHNLTSFRLEGAHREIKCAECHIKLSQNGHISEQNFRSLLSTCKSCHDNPHGIQFDLSGNSDCSGCHQTENWYPDLFDHGLTKFPLSGRHAEIECKACHKDVVMINGRSRTNFEMESFDCIDCHQ